MALIGKIRKNYWLILIVLGLALAAFIMMDMTGASGPQGATTLTMGEIDGERIDYRAFQATESAYYGNAQGDPFTKRKAIWDFYVEDALLKKEGDKLGMTVSTDELMDLQFGANQSPIIQQNWRNPQTGQLDVATLNSFKTAIENGDDMNPQFRAYWAEQEKQIIKESLEGKLNNLVSNAVYTPNWMAEESHKLDNDKVDFNYIKIPFDQIPNTVGQVADSEIVNFAQQSARKDKYMVNELTREVEFAVYKVEPSQADVEAISAEVAKLKSDFINSKDDSLFTVTNNGIYSHLYGTTDQMPAGARNQITALNPGEVYGPFEDNGFSMIIKMLDKRNIPDSVDARHILIATSPDNPAATTAAFAKIDSIKRAYRSGSSFEDLALAHSDDSSNKNNGGSLGMADQTRYVPEFTTAAFTGKVGGLYTVKTQFGVHLLEVQNQVFGTNPQKYRVASIGRPVIPSQETQDKVYDEVTEILSANKNIQSLRTALDSNPNVFMESSSPLRANDYTLGSLGADNSSREIIKWAYDLSTELGDVSPEIYRFTDKVNYYDNKYVLAALKAIVPAGMQSASSLRNQIGTAVLNNKNALAFASGLKVNNLQDAASANGVTVQTASDVGSKSSIITGIGKEPKVLAAAFGLDISAVSQPIVGESGVYIVQPISRQDPNPATNLPFLKNNLSNSTKTQVDFSIIKNMIKRADIKDERSMFF